MRLELILDLEPTVKVPERVRFGHENVHLSANHSSAFLTRRAVIGFEVHIFLPKSYTFRNFYGILECSILFVDRHHPLGVFVKKKSLL